MHIVEATSTTITRPNDTTAYASGDLIANSTTAGSVTPFLIVIPFARSFKIWKATILKSDKTLTNAKFRVHLFRDSPTVANGDNGALSPSRSEYQGFIDVDMTATTPPTFSDTGTGHSALTAPVYVYADADRMVYGLLAATAAYTPTAQETFQIKLIGEAYV